MIANSKVYWREISERSDWKQYILPRKDEKDFDIEGLLEAHRLYYLFDNQSTVVDYGCGIGRVLQFVSQRAGRTIGLDITSSFLQKAGLALNGNVELYQTEEFTDESMADLVYCLMVMQHNGAENRNLIIGHIHKILKHGGFAVISFPSIESNYYVENEFCHKFTREEVMALALPFESFRVVSGNLPGYAAEVTGVNEYFLIAVKGKGTE